MNKINKALGLKKKSTCIKKASSNRDNKIIVRDFKTTNNR
jgi:hypothetical protein